MFFSGFLLCSLLPCLLDKLVAMVFLLVLLFVFSSSMMMLVLEYSFFFEIWILDYISFLMVILSVSVIYLSVLVDFECVSLKFFLLKKFLLYGLVFCFLSDSLMYMYIFFESSLVPLMLMIVFKGGSYFRFSSILYLLVFTLFGSFFMLVLLMFFKNSLSLFLSPLFFFFSGFGFIWFVMFFMFLVKLPVFGLHFWLPKAHVEASVSGSMILAGVLLKLGGYGFIRLFFFLNINSFFLLKIFLVSVSLLGVIWSSVCCLRQMDIKLLVAYSSVAHMGIVLGGLMSFNLAGLMGSVGLMVAHGFCSSGLFFLSNLFYEKLMTRSLFLMKGFFSIFSGLIYCWVVMLLCNMGVPLSLNFFSELLLVISICSFSVFNTLAVLIFLVMSVMYSLLLVNRMMHGGMWVYSVCLMDSKFNLLVVFLHLCVLYLYIFMVDFIFLIF